LIWQVKEYQEYRYLMLSVSYSPYDMPSYFLYAITNHMYMYLNHNTVACLGTPFS